MKSRHAWLPALLLAFQPALAEYRTALPGYRYSFPRDHFSHPDFKTEWWYYTGNLRTPDGRRFGFELTFFREALKRDGSPSGAWDAGDLYLAHMALSDLDHGRFLHSERSNRAGPGLAGADQAAGRIWNGNWSVRWNGDTQELRATEARFALGLTLRSRKPPVIHGENGVSQKSEGAGRGSHYISLTRLETEGQIRLGRQTVEVAGTAWMDHEFFTEQLGSGQVGWDWLSMQLENNTELMLFRIRRKDGTADRFSAGTFVDTQGRATHLKESDFVLKPSGRRWTSGETRASYPIAWTVRVAALALELEAGTSLASQELPGKTGSLPSYWEGAISLTGQSGSASIRGVGYLELTGYDRPVELGR